jgi:hypothetical protein
MNYADLKKLMDEDRIQNPDQYKRDEEFKWTEPPATDDEIAFIEDTLGVKLPSDYVSLLKDYGGGVVGGPEILSAHKDSSDFILLHQPPADLVQDFVAVMENGCGDYYGFKVEEGKCETGLTFCDHELGYELEPTEYHSIIDYIAACGWNVNED